MNSLSQFKSLAVAAALLSSAIAGQAQTQVIYNNTGDPVLGTYAPTDKSLEFGDQIILDLPPTNPWSLEIRSFSMEMPV